MKKIILVVAGTMMQMTAGVAGAAENGKIDELGSGLPIKTENTQTPEQKTAESLKMDLMEQFKVVSAKCQPLRAYDYQRGGVDALLGEDFKNCLQADTTLAETKTFAQNPLAESQAIANHAALLSYFTIPYHQAELALDAGDLAAARQHWYNYLAVKDTLENLPGNAGKKTGVALPKDAKVFPDLLQDAWTKAFWGNFGVALIMNRNTNPAIKNATVTPDTTTTGIGGTVVKGVIRVDKETEYKTSIGLEAHKFMLGLGNSHSTEKQSILTGSLALGPYISITPGPGEIVDVLGAGLVLGLLGDTRFEKKGGRTSMNLAAGWFWDFNSPHLEQGFTEGQALPPNESQVRLHTTTDMGWQFMISFSVLFDTPGTDK